MEPDNGIARAPASSMRVMSVRTSFDLRKAFMKVSPNYVKYISIKSLEKGFMPKKEKPPGG
jgi:hypothetical protein